MLTRRSQRAVAVRIIVAILAVLVAMWVVWKLLLNHEPAPAPEVKIGHVGVIGMRAPSSTFVAFSAESTPSGLRQDAC